MTIEQNKAANDYCMKLGALLGIIFLVQYALLVLASTNLFFSLVRTPLMLVTPFILGLATYRLKERVFTDEFPWLVAWLYGIRIMLYASLIEAAGIVIYNQWIDPANLYHMQQSLIAQYEEARQMLAVTQPSDASLTGSILKACDESITLMRESPVQTPIQTAFASMANNLFGGMFWMTIIASIFYRKQNIKTT
ncbi:MAG: DUF4199 domain-containing protein [Bacteroidales bacterium]|nr:DUF4199 domain-containing protein [Bacteroidales bacterium]